MAALNNPATKNVQKMRYSELLQFLPKSPRTWLITGVAGFIGSNLLEALLRLGQRVVGLDNFSTGCRGNLDQVKTIVGDETWQQFSFIEGDIRDLAVCREAVTGVNYVLHQAALGSVPRSLEDPLQTHGNNVNGFLNMLLASRDAKVARFVYAASSSTYGDHPGLPKVEDQIGKPLSPYAVTKYVNELYAEVFGRCYGTETIGLRYFNVFGPRQDPNGAYAAVIPRWLDALLRGQTVFINGDGETSRDFCFIDNAVQANLLAATAVDNDAINQLFNVAYGERTTLNQLFSLIREQVTVSRPEAAYAEPTHLEFRTGDVRHSLADISKARKLLGYEPMHSVRQGLVITTNWYACQKKNAPIVR